MSYLITIQYPYNYLTVTLSHDTTIIATETISKFQAIGQLIPAIKRILESQKILLPDIACIGINTGPGPFNTLRTIIATANAISFAKQIPLVACNGLDLMLQEAAHKNTVVLLDAFGQDVYFATSYNNQQGYSSIEKVIEELNLLSQKDAFLFIGNGAAKHQELIKKNLKNAAAFDENCLFADEQTLVNETYKKFNQGKVEKELFPLYFASPVVKS